jgi:hypothetical protein
MVQTTYSVLILGASYGSLLATRLLGAGHNVKLVCRAATADLINRHGTRVRLPVKSHGTVDVDSRKLPGVLTADAPSAVHPADYDLVVLAMQEPQYTAPDLRALLGRVGLARVPCMSIMNMPPPPYLKRMPSLQTEPLASCYADPAAWESFDPAQMTLCSPDPQAFRPPEEGANVLLITLPTNFKAAPFASKAASAMLRRIEADIEAVRYAADGEAIELPVKLKVYDSIFVPLAKWAMLLTGNYRCVTRNGPRPINEVVHADLDESRSVYDWVRNLCMALGASSDDLVPFEKYAAAAQGLSRPSSSARALFAGAASIERLDRLVQAIAAQQGLRHPIVDETVDQIDARLAANRKAVA